MYVCTYVRVSFPDKLPRVYEQRSVVYTWPHVSTGNRLPATKSQLSAEVSSLGPGMARWDQQRSSICLRRSLPANRSVFLGSFRHHLAVIYNVWSLTKIYPLWSLDNNYCTGSTCANLQLRGDAQFWYFKI